MEPVIQALTTLQESLRAITVPIAIIGFFGWGIARLISPLLPEWAQSMRGYFQNAMLTLVVLGFIATLVPALMAVGGGTPS